MPEVSVEKSKDLMSAFRKLKKICGNILSKSPKKNDRFHTPDSKKRRMARQAAVSREKKRQQRLKMRNRSRSRRGA